MNPSITLIRGLAIVLVVVGTLVVAAGARAHGGGMHLNQSEVVWRTFGSLSLLRGASASSSCTSAERSQELRDAQRQVLELLGSEQPVDDPTTPDLTTLANRGDLAALAALGYNVYAHQQVSFEGTGWPVVDGLAPQDPLEAKPVAGRPSVLLYAPTPPQPPLTVTAPRDGFDFPYSLAGWLYLFPFQFAQHPIVGGDGQPFLTCVERADWVVHERGIHPFDTGRFTPVPPEDEVDGGEVHGTAPGSLPPTEYQDGRPLQPGDIPRPRVWDLPVWLVENDDVPTVQMRSPYTIPGVDLNVGVSPPPNWPDEPYPAFYYPIALCSAPDRDQVMRQDQQAVLMMLLGGMPGDLTTLENEADLAALAALGYGVHPHRQTSFRGMGWEVYNPLYDPANSPASTPSAGHPPLLIYEPSGVNVNLPDDGFDFPYRLRGWAYLANYDFDRQPLPPLVPRCLAREEWFVHERGLHPFATGGMEPDPPEEEMHGTAPGPPGSEPLPENPGDLGHTRMWDVHIWLDLDGGAVPIIQMLNPGPPMPGIDPGVGVSPPPNWPGGPYPGFYYPPRATDLSVTLADSPDPVAIGSNITYSISVPNAGPNVATNVQLSDEVPANTTFASLEQTSGPSATCTTPPAAGRGTVGCSIASLDAGGSASFALRVRVDSGVAPRTTITNEATVTSATADQRGANNRSTAESATTGPTAVRLRSFSAEASSRGLLLRWLTGSEANTLGFNLFSQQFGKLVKLNQTLIHSTYGGTTKGQAYSWFDRNARRGVTYTYRLQAVSRGGTRAWLGRVIARL